jgi:hypothetical protein
MSRAHLEHGTVTEHDAHDVVVRCPAIRARGRHSGQVVKLSKSTPAPHERAGSSALKT